MGYFTFPVSYRLPVCFGKHIITFTSMPHSIYKEHVAGSNIHYKFILRQEEFALDTCILLAHKR